MPLLNDPWSIFILYSITITILLLYLPILKKIIIYSFTYFRSLSRSYVENILK